MITFYLIVVGAGAVIWLLGLALDRYRAWRRHRQEVVTFYLVADTTKFQRAMRDLSRDFQRMGEQMGAVFLRALGPLVQALHPRLDLLMEQNKYGAGNRAADGTWLSDACATWIHTTCPGLGCACRCHR